MNLPSYESMATDYIFSMPITHLIDQSAIESGFDPNDPKRRMLAEAGSAVMGFMVGTALGGPLGFIAGLMGYCIGMGSRPAGEERYRPLPHETRNGLAVMQAGTRACGKLCDQIDGDLCIQLRERLMASCGADEEWRGKSAYDVMKHIYDVFYAVDARAANLWAAILERELND